jgi:hypothetical protein
MLPRLEHFNNRDIGTELKRQPVLSEIDEPEKNRIDGPGRMIVFGTDCNSLNESSAETEEGKEKLGQLACL